MDLDALEARLRAGGVGTVVATLGTTALGAVDDVGAIADLCEEHGVRLHVDAAYGGFFSLIADGGEPGVAAGPFDAVRAGRLGGGRPAQARPAAVRVRLGDLRRPGGGPPVRHDSPYTYFTSSRPAPGRDQPGVLAVGGVGRGAVGDAPRAAADARRARPAPRGARAAGLAGGAPARRPRASRRAGARHRLLFSDYPSAAAITASTERAFDALAGTGWHLAKLRLDTEWLRRSRPWIEADAPTVTVLRSCLLKREHLGIIDDLGDRLTVATTPPDVIG